MTKKTTRKIHARRFRFNASYKKAAEFYLSTADELWKRSAGLDTAVRDSLAEGLAYIVQAGNDCAAQNIRFATTDEWMSWIDKATADWFRVRGFAEWFCLGAASSFRTSRPRTLSTDFFNEAPGDAKVVRRRRRRTSKAA